MKNSILRFSVFMSIFLVNYGTARANSVSYFSGKWESIVKTDSSDTPYSVSNLSLTEDLGGNISGAYCFVTNFGGKIDCGKDTDRNITGKVIKGNPKTATVRFNPFFGAKNGVAKLEINNDSTITWAVTTQPKGGNFYGPNHAIFNKNDAVNTEGLCKPNETVFFNCKLRESASSLCRSKINGTLTYRNGNSTNENIHVSDDGANKGKVFFFSSVPKIGGGEAHIRFSHLGYTYYLYDVTMRSDGIPTSYAGIVVLKNKNRIANFECRNDASITEKAYQVIPSENYREIK